MLEAGAKILSNLIRIGGFCFGCIEKNYFACAESQKELIFVRHFLLFSCLNLFLIMSKTELTAEMHTYFKLLWENKFHVRNGKLTFSIF
jgi:uncharacterized membrane protein required for colicin V production